MLTCMPQTIKFIQEYNALLTQYWKRTAAVFVHVVTQTEQQI